MATDRTVYVLYIRTILFVDNRIITLPINQLLFTFEELLISNMIEQEALVNLLERKGLISEQELLEEIQRLKRVTERKVRLLTEKSKPTTW